MPRKKAKDLTTKEKTEYFISLYVKKGALDSQISWCEKRAALKPGEGSKLLRNKAVQEEITKRKQPAETEKLLQKAVAAGAATAREQMQQELTRQLSPEILMTVKPEILEHQLMLGVVGLDWNRFPKEKLDVIKMAAVWNGIFEAGNTRRLTPAETGQPDATGGLYVSLFNRIAQNPTNSETSLQTPPMLQGDVYDLTPPPAVIQAPPPPETPEPSRKTKPNVLVVNVG